MNKLEALAAIDHWISKGWHFSIDGEECGWTCRVVGAGLAHAECGGETFEAAVELALSHATAMEDDPNVVLARYEKTLVETIEKIWGKEAFKGFEITVDKWDFGPKRIEYIIEPNLTPKEVVDKEVEFWHETGNLPKEIFIPLRMQIRWPDEVKTS